MQMIYSGLKLLPRFWCCSFKFLAHTCILCVWLAMALTDDEQSQVLNVVSVNQYPQCTTSN